MCVFQTRVRQAKFRSSVHNARDAQQSISLAESLPGFASTGDFHAILQDYYITDGLYGSFNCILYDHAQPTARPLSGAAIARAGTSPTSPGASDCGSWLPLDNVRRVAGEAPTAAAPPDCAVGGELVASTVFGPSCDGLDTVFHRWAPRSVRHNPIEMYCSTSQSRATSAITI